MLHSGGGWRGCVVAIVATGLAYAIRTWLAGAFGAQFVFATFSPAVMLAAMVGGLYPGFLSTALSVVLSMPWSLTHQESFTTQRTADAVSLLVFACTGVFMSVLAERYHRAQRRASALEKSLALRESEERYRTLADSAPDGIFRFDREFRLLYANPVGAHWLGLHGPLELSAPGQSRPAIFLPEWESTTREVFETGQLRRFETSIEVSGKERTYEVLVAPESSADGSVRAVVSVARDVTDRKRAEEALRESEARLKKAQEISHLGSWELDLGGNRLSWSDEVYRIFGMQPQQFSATYEAFLEAVHPDDRVGVDAAYSGSLREGRDTYEIEHRVIRRSDGEIRFVHEKCEHVRGATGQIIRSVGMVQDITERIKGEEALRESEERFRIMADGSPVIIWVTDAEGENQFVNRHYQEFFGVTREQVEGCRWSMLIHPDDAPKYTGGFSRAVRERQPFSVEARVRRADGEWRSIISYGEPRFSPAGEYLGHIGISLDITERKEAEEALRESEIRLRTLSDNLPGGLVYQIDSGVDGQERRFTYFSAGVGQLHEVSAAEAMGDASLIYGQIVEEDRREVAEREASAALSGTAFKVEARIRLPSGRLCWRLFTSAPRRLPNHHLVWDGVEVDITERKRTEEDRIRLERQILQAQKFESLGVLAGGIAHDFNNLLMGVLGYADLALLEIPPASPLGEYLAHIKTTAIRLGEISKQMLAYSGRGRFVVEPLDLSALVTEMADLLRISLPKKVALKLDLSFEVPPILADGSQIRQVVMNLLTNAAESIGEEGGLVTVRTGTIAADRDYLSELSWNQELPEGLYVYLEISDTGGGMTLEVQARIFDPFFTTKTTGRGLGLAAVQGIVSGHKGAIKVYSETGKGSTFKVLLPGTESGGEIAAAWKVARPLAPRGAGQTILVIDDEETVRTVSRMMLKKAGYTVLTAESGEEALAMLREPARVIDLVLLDLTMPRMSGLETFIAIHRVAPDLPVVLCSGYNEQDATNQFVGKGLADFIQKPFEFQSIARKVGEVLARKAK